MFSCLCFCTPTSHHWTSSGAICWFFEATGTFPESYWNREWRDRSQRGRGGGMIMEEHSVLILLSCVSNRVHLKWFISCRSIKRWFRTVNSDWCSWPITALRPRPPPPLNSCLPLCFLQLRVEPRWSVRCLHHSAEEIIVFISRSF